MIEFDDFRWYNCKVIENVRRRLEYAESMYDSK